MTITKRFLFLFCGVLTACAAAELKPLENPQQNSKLYLNQSIYWNGITWVEGIKTCSACTSAAGFQKPPIVVKDYYYDDRFQLWRSLENGSTCHDCTPEKGFATTQAEDQVNVRPIGLPDYLRQMPAATRADYLCAQSLLNAAQVKYPLAEKVIWDNERYEESSRKFSAMAVIAHNDEEDATVVVSCKLNSDITKVSEIETLFDE